MFVNEYLSVVFATTHVLFITVTADYQCLCNYNVELTVYSKPSSVSHAIGFVYEFDCKGLYGMFNKTSLFHQIQFEHKIGYLQQNNNLQLQLCPGSLPAEDLVNITTEVTQRHSTASVVTSSSIRFSSPPTITYSQAKTTASIQNTSATISAIGSVETSVTTPASTKMTSPASTNMTSPASTNLTSPVSTNVTTPVAASVTAPLVINMTLPAATSVTTAAGTRVTKSATSSAQTVTSKPICPNNWILHGTSCYLFKTHQRKPWDDASKDCRTLHAHLVTIETPFEDQFIREQSSHRVDTQHHGDSQTGVWLGGTDRNIEGHWEWTEPVAGVNKLVQDYSNWYNHEPDSGDGKHDEDCMCMIGDKGFHWQDAQCSKDMFYVCERTAHVSHVTSAPVQTQSPMIQTNTTVCPHGWILNDGSCYLFNTAESSTWFRADSFCSAHQAHLVIIETADEDHFIVQEASHRINMHAKHEIDTGVWIAGTDDDREGHWEWKDGFSYRPIHGYKNWYPGEPDSGAKDHDEDCMCLIGKRGFQWQDFKCDTHMFSICEKPVANIAPLVG